MPPRCSGLLHRAVVPGKEGDRHATGARALVLDLALGPMPSQVVDEALGNLSAEVVLLAPDPALAGELGSRGAFDPERDLLAGACASSVTFLHFLVPLSFGLSRLGFYACGLLRGVLLLGGLVLRLLVPTATRREDGRSQEPDERGFDLWVRDLTLLGGGVCPFSDPHRRLPSEGRRMPTRILTIV